MKRTYRKRKGWKIGKRILSMGLLIMIGLLPAQEFQTYGMSDGTESISLSNPRIEEYEFKETHRKMTWDSVFFGSYPQAEIVPSLEQNSIENLDLENGDIIMDDDMYFRLRNASGWDKNGDIALNGERYRRIRKAEAVSVKQGFSGEYDWKAGNAYHYFKYEPIRWRVLSVDEGKMMLLADKVLDDQKYNERSKNVTWEKSTIRSFLNGYSSTENEQGIDYESRRNFYDTAFGDEEKEALLDVDVSQGDSLENQSSQARGNDTTDKVFLLSDSETYGTDKAASYGFGAACDEYDEARMSKCSTYAKAMGTAWSTDMKNLGCCDWWLRSPGSEPNPLYNAMGVMRIGYVYSAAMDNDDLGIRPVVILSRDFADLFSYAGVVRSDGSTAVEAGAMWKNPGMMEYEIRETRQKVTWDCVSFGNYPQAEVVASIDKDDAYTRYFDDGRGIVDSSLYASLQKASGWDQNGDIILGGIKYRRIREEDLIDGTTNDSHWWGEKVGYRYFQYQPIKWRVLSIHGGRALLLADRVLDIHPFDKNHNNMSWGNSMIRSFLNGYGSSENRQGQDYASGRNFIDTAFEGEEKKLLQEIEILNDDSLKNQLASESMKKTKDKVFLLSYYDLSDSEKSQSYGFSEEIEEFESRMGMVSAFARARGVYLNFYGSGGWSLRSSADSYYGDRSGEIICIFADGGVASSYPDSEEGNGIRPAIVLDVESLDSASFAGIVHSDGMTQPGKTVVSLKGHIHDTDVVWKANGESHWKECWCKERTEFGSHDYRWIVDKKATKKETGLKHEECTVCGYMKNKQTVIPKLSKGENIAKASMTGLKSDYTYTGKAIKPPIVLTLNGKKLTEADYTLSYLNDKNVGTATVTATGKGSFTGTIVRKFSILPKKTTLKKLAAGKKKMIVEWEKQDVQTTGYQIQYSLKKSMKSAKMKTVKKAGDTSLTVKKLKSKKTYYVRVRTCKNVKGKNYASTWSAVKSVKIK